MTCPLIGRIKPQMPRTRVVLPMPLGPKMPRHRPTCRSMRSACTTGRSSYPKRAWRTSTSIAVGLSGWLGFNAGGTRRLDQLLDVVTKELLIGVGFGHAVDVVGQA